MRKRAFLLLTAVLIFLTISCVGTETDPQLTDNVSSLQEDETMTETKPETHPETGPEPDILGELIAALSLEEKVGQLFLVRLPENGIDRAVSEYKVGNFILFANDFSGLDKNEAVNKIASLQSQSDIGMLIAVDEEGGNVNRVSKYPSLRESPSPSPSALFKKGGIGAIRADAAEKGAFLRSFGINLNLAPVADVSTDPKDFIFPRTVGQDAATTARAVAAAVEGMNAAGIACSLKHFPGYGNNADTHTGIAIDKRPLSSFRENDLVPFRAGIEAGVGTVMVSHNIVKCMDPDRPASLSPKVHCLLRDDLGFDGVIITDELSMGAILEYTDGKSAAVAAVLAGNDLLCVTDFETQITAVIEAVRNGTIPEERIDTSLRRVLKLKKMLGLI